MLDSVFHALQVPLPGVRPLLVIASSNPGKVSEIVAMLEMVDIEVRGQPEGLDVEETGRTFAENARLKATAVAVMTGQWTLADDSGLAVDALNGAPGIYSARYASDASLRVARLLAELRGSLYRSATFISAIALANPSGQTVLEAQGECRGEILEQPRGAGSTGYDSVFWIRAAGCTYGELSTSQKLKFGSRGKAVRSIADDVKSVLNLQVGPGHPVDSSV